MRTGAIFARGSCRALKWMAVLGMFSILASAQAFAQPVMDSATYTATGMTVTVTLSEEAYLNLTSGIAAELAGDFAIIGGTTGATAATDAAAVGPVAASGLATTRFPGSRTITLRFNQVVSGLKGSATAAALQLVYTAPGAAREIKATSDDETMVTETQDLAGPGVVTDGLTLTIPATLKDVALRTGTTITTAIALPAAKGASAAANLDYDLSGLPNGLVDGTADTDTTPSTISGTVPTFIGTWTLVYTVTDSSPIDNASARDTLTLRSADKPARMAKPTVTVGGPSSLVVKWVEPATNNDPINEYKVRYKPTAGTTWTPVVATITGKTHTLTGLTPGSYDVQVRAINDFSLLTDGSVDTDWSPSTTMSTGPAPRKPTIGLDVASVIPENRNNIPVTVTVTVPPLPAGQSTTRTVSVTLALAGPAATVKAEDAAELPSTLETNPDVVWDSPLSSAKPASRAPMTFTFSSNLTSSQTVHVHTRADTDAEPEYFRVTASSAEVTNIFAKGAATPKAVMIDDAQEQLYALRLNDYALETSRSLKEGNQGAVVPMTLMVMPPRTIAKSFIVSLESANDSADYSLSSGGLSSAGVANNRLRIDMGVLEGSRGVNLTTAPNDGDREDDIVTLKVYDASATTTTAVGDQRGDSVTLTVVDQHKLPKVTLASIDGTAMFNVAEGQTATVELMVDRGTATDDVPDDEAITVMLSRATTSTASDADYRLDSAVVKVGTKKSATFKIEALADDDIGDEMLVLQAEVKGAAVNGATGETMNLAAITITDATTKLVWAKTQDEVEAAIYDAKNDGMGDDEKFNPGEMIEVMGSALFNAGEGVTLSYSAESSDMDVASAMSGDGTVTVTAKGEGDAMITITAHASMPSSVMINDQTDPREASITFPVEVGLEALSFMLKGPEDMHIVEGGMAHANGTAGAAMLTVTANRAVGMDTEVMIMRDRAMSTAMDSDYMPVPTMIMIEAGEMMGSVEITATEDDMAEDMEELVLYAMVGDMSVEGEVKLYIWDAAVPALPIIAQLLLAAFLAVGGYRRYLRR